VTLTEVVTFSFILFPFDVDLFELEIFFDDGFHFEFPFEVDLFEFEPLVVVLGFFQMGCFQLGFFELVFFLELVFFSWLSPNASPFSQRPCDKLSLPFGFFAMSFCLLVLHFGLLPPGFLNQGLLLQYGFLKLSNP